MSIYFVGYALFRRQFGCWVPICQSNTLVPGLVLHRFDDKDLISLDLDIFQGSVIDDICKYLNKQIPNKVHMKKNESVKVA